ncbi:MFS transporter [Microbacterium lacus]|uniref:MFS transporter n=1 Tax=Microbacterium lacus TaxID=415217 RepID=A0ABP4RYU1_9MICO
MSVPDAAVAVQAPDAGITPVGRLLPAMFASNVSAFIGLLTPLQVLMTLHLTRIAGPGAAAAFGIITGFGALAALIASPLGGRISDRTAARFGRRRTWILTGAIAGSATVLGMAFTTEVWQMALLWCGTQALFNFQLAATSALMADQVPERRRGTASGLLGLSAAVGPLVGVAAVSAVSDPFLQWIVTAVAATGLAVVSVLMLRDRQHPRPEGEASLGVVELLKSFWLNPWKHPAFGWAWLVRFLVFAAVASSTYNAFFLMDRFDVSPEEVPASVLVLTLLNVVALALTAVIAGPLSDRVQRQKPFAAGAGVAAAIALALMAIATDMWFVYAASALLGIAIGLVGSVDLALCVRVLPNKENAGKDLGVINMAGLLPQSIVPFVAPVFLALGGYALLYVVLGIAALIGALAVLRIPEIGREGDPRFAAITRTSASAA